MDELKIAAVVVTYNRKELLKKCVESLLNQTYPLEKIIIVDNASIDGTAEFLQLYRYLNNNKIRYVKLQENFGGAGGFYTGIKIAHQEGFDWIWTFDDDTEAKKNALEKLVEHITTPEISLTSLLVSDKEKLLLHHRGYINFNNLFKKPTISFSPEKIGTGSIVLTFSSFSGLLISKETVSIIGYPKKEFFVFYDDLFYSIKMFFSKRKILLVPNSIVIHYTPEIKLFIEKKFLWKKSFRRDILNFWVVYYSKRNLIFLSKKYQNNKLKFFLTMYISTLRFILSILIFDDFKILRILLLIKSLFDGLTGHLGKTISPEEWKKIVIRK